MGRQKVVSREYKVMLRESRFNGNEKRLRKAIGAFWHEFSTHLITVAIESRGGLNTVKHSRVINFFDTSKQRLNRSSYIFRERRRLDNGEREVTLKFRHPDRNVSQDREMDARNGSDARTKFEEDIKAPFVSLYSFSTTIRIDEERTFKTLEKIARLFPDIAGRVDRFREDDKLRVVGGFTAREAVFTGGEIQLGKRSRADAECALIVWHDHNRRSDRPVAVEFSYRYGNKDEEYDGGMSLRAYDVFEVLRLKLGKWVDSRPTTKTALVYA